MMVISGGGRERTHLLTPQRWPFRCNWDERDFSFYSSIQCRLITSQCHRFAFAHEAIQALPAIFSRASNVRNKSVFRLLAQSASTAYNRERYHRNRIVADRSAELREFLSAYIDFDCYAKERHSMVVCEGSWAARSEGKVEQANFLRFRQSLNNDYRGYIVWQFSSNGRTMIAQRKSQNFGYITPRTCWAAIVDVMHEKKVLYIKRLHIFKRARWYWLQPFKYTFVIWNRRAKVLGYWQV